MIYTEIFRLFFTVAVFWIYLAKGDNRCSLEVPDGTELRKLPIVFTIDRNKKSYLVYPDQRGYLTVRSNSKIMFSCASTTFALSELNNIQEIEVTCTGGTKFYYNGTSYEYAQLICAQYIPTDTKKSERKCQPNNNTIFDVGYKTGKYFFTLYSVCFDEKNLNTLYTWYTLRVPFVDKIQKQKRTGFFKHAIYGNLDLNSLYGKSMQRETINKILKLGDNINNYMCDKDLYLSKAHFISRTDFYFAREQVATFNYLNVSPQWFKSNNVWAEIEMVIRAELEKNPYSKRVIVSGVFGSFTLPDVNKKQRELYLVMPTEQLAVPQFQWKLVYDATNVDNSVVYISYNHPRAEVPAEVHTHLRCSLKPCPGAISNKITRPWINSNYLYCCDIVSFQNTYGWFERDVFNVLTSVSPTPAA